MSQEEQNPQVQQKKKPSYNVFTHVVDKCILHFFAGLFLAGPIGLLIILHIGRISDNHIISLILFLMIIGSIGYAFFGIGVNCSHSKEESYHVKTIPALIATFFSSVVFLFPLYFLQSVIRLVMDIVPRYNMILIKYMPKIAISSHLLESNFCEPGSRSCFFTSWFGRVLQHLIDLFILCIGLSTLFFIVNAIVVIISVSSKNVKD